MFDYGQSETVGDKETGKDDGWTGGGRGGQGGNEGQKKSRRFSKPRPAPSNQQGCEAGTSRRDSPSLFPQRRLIERVTPGPSLVIHSVVLICFPRDLSASTQLTNRSKPKGRCSQTCVNNYIRIHRCSEK